MSDTTGVMPARSARLFRIKHLVFAVIAATAAYVLYHNERFLLDAAHPVWNHYEPFKWWLLPHGLAGACALLLAPMQFAEKSAPPMYAGNHPLSRCGPSRLQRHTTIGHSS